MSRRVFNYASAIVTAVGAMEVALGLFDSDRYYNWLDNYLRSDEVKE